MEHMTDWIQQKWQDELCKNAKINWTKGSSEMDTVLPWHLLNWMCKCGSALRIHLVRLMIRIIFRSRLSFFTQMVLMISYSVFFYGVHTKYSDPFCQYFATINVVFWSRLSILTPLHPLRRSQTIFCCSTWQQVHSLKRICSLSWGWNDAKNLRKVYTLIIWTTWYVGLHGM